jgi:hypothetical protein
VPPWICHTMLPAGFALLAAIGLRGFQRRAIH